MIDYHAVGVRDACLKKKKKTVAGLKTWEMNDTHTQKDRESVSDKR